MLRHTVSSKCSDLVPRSGAAGEAVDCYVTKVKQGTEPPPVALSFDGQRIGCVAWNGSRYEVELDLQLRDLHLSQFEVVHFYGLSEVRYAGVWDFVRNHVTRWPYIKIYVVRRLVGVNQYFFNKRKLLTQKRNRLLTILVNRKLEGQDSVSPIDLMSAVYTDRWVEHPDWKAANARLEAYLEAMVDTGELERDGHKYKVTGRAFRALEESEELDRRHGENVLLQRSMVWLTVAIAFFAAVQAQLLKLPTLLDFTK